MLSCTWLTVPVVYLQLKPSMFLNNGEPWTAWSMRSMPPASILPCDAICVIYFAVPRRTHGSKPQMLSLDHVPFLDHNRWHLHAQKLTDSQRNERLPQP